MVYVRIVPTYLQLNPPNCGGGLSFAHILLLLQRCRQIEKAACLPACLPACLLRRLLACLLSYKINSKQQGIYPRTYSYTHYVRKE